MSKKWKLKLINKFLHLYTKVGGNLKDKRSFSKDLEFTSIVIYSTTALGDLMFNTPAIRAIKNRYPSAKITLLSSKKNKSLVAESKYFDKIIYWDEKFKDIAGVVYRLKKEKPQLAIILHSKAPYDVVSAMLSGCQYIFKDIYGNKASGVEQWLTGYSGKFEGHLIQRKLNLVALLGCEVENEQMLIPVSYLRQEKEMEYKDIGFQMGASEQLRCWPIECFIELAKIILDASPEYRIVLIGTAKEHEIGKMFFQGLSPIEQKRVVNYIGKTSLPQLLSIIENLDVLITGDTGPLHLAIALKTKTVSLFVTANPKHTGPIQDTELHQIMYIPADTVSLTTEQKSQPLSIIKATDVFNKIKLIE